LKIKCAAPEGDTVDATRKVRGSAREMLRAWRPSAWRR